MADDESTFTPTGAAGAGDRPPDGRFGAVGADIGPYRLRSVLGQGGFSIVYLAEQQHPIRRRVALKINKLGMDTRQFLARFEAERQALAMMDHPNIARVFDAGATDAGRPYFVMELVHGEAITDYCDRHKLGIEQRLALFIDVCHGVQHAHQKGVIHRDLKPSNVLVTVQDDRPTPKIIDFGVAKATAQPLTERTLFTEQGQLIGTPEYMSPEQAEMSATDVDTRSDVYSLGVLLYELLTGALPFERAALRRAGFGEVQRIIREVEPAKPSTKLSSLGEASTASAHRRASEAPALVRRLRGDLDWITMKALDKDRARRYATAAALAEDVHRYLTHEPVSAGPPGAVYVLGKLLRKHRGPVTVAMAFVGLLIGALLVSTALFMRAESARRRADRSALAEAQQRRKAERERAAATAARQEAEKEAAKAKAVTKFLQDTLGSINPSKARGRKLTLHQALHEAAQMVAGRFTGQPGTEIAVRRTIAKTCLSLGEYDTAVDQLSAALKVAGELLGDDDPVTLRMRSTMGFALMQQGKHVKAEALHRATLETRRRVLGPLHPDTLGSMQDLGSALQEQGKLREAEKLLREAIEAGRSLSSEYNLLVALNSLASVISDQGKHAEAERIYRHVLGETHRLRGSDHPFSLACMNNLANELRAQRKHEEAARLHRETLEKSQRILGRDHPGTLTAMGNLAHSYRDQGKYAEAEKLNRQMLEGRRRVLGEDDPYAIDAMEDLAATLICEEKLSEAEKLLRGTLAARERVLGGDHHDTLRAIDDLIRILGRAHKPDEAEKLRLEAAAVRRRIEEKEIARRPPDRFLRERRTLRGHTKGVRSVAFSPDGKTLATGSFDLTAKLWDIGTCQVRGSVRGHSADSDWHRTGVNSVAFAPSGDMLATGGLDGVIGLWSSSTTEELAKLTGHLGRVLFVVFAPDGKTLVSAGEDGTVRVWDVATGAQRRRLEEHSKPVECLCFSPGGNALVSGSCDQTAKLWDTSTWKVLSSLRGHDGWVLSVAFSPDGRTLATSGTDKMIKLWHMPQARERAVFRCPSGNVHSLAFSPDGKTLASGGADKTVRLWDVATEKMMMKLTGHSRRVWSVAFSPDGGTLATGSWDGTVKLWDVIRPKDLVPDSSSQPGNAVP